MDIVAFFRQFSSIKWQALSLLLCYVIYLIVSLNGTKLTGDDNAIRNVAAGRSQTGNHFYHK